MESNFIKKCKELGISPSITRVQIYDYLEHSKTHPTVDEIYQDLVSILPTLSKTTVYNVLRLFLEHDLIDVISTASNEKRYEIKDSSHSHFLCKVCNTIYDIPQVSISYDKDKISHYQVDNQQVTLVGICPACMEKQKI